MLEHKDPFVHVVEHTYHAVKITPDTISTSLVNAGQN